MCFSASASFGAGLVLAVAGAVTVKKATSLRMIPFASIPFLFAFQQVAEGLGWVCLSNPSLGKYQQLPVDVYLICSHLLWPVWMPFSIWLIEKGKQKKILFALLLTGIILGLYHLCFILAYPPAAEITSCHIDYAIRLPRSLMVYSSILYGFTAVIPAFISSTKRMWWLGATLVISYAASKIFYEEYLVSVFCFFAALLSVIIYFIIDRQNRNV